MGIIDDISQIELDFEQKYIDLMKQQMKRSVIFVSKQYRPIADHFCIQETMPAYEWVGEEKPVKKEVGVPDQEAHYLVETDTIVINYKTIMDFCVGLKYNKHGSLVEHMPLAHVRVRDLIFLVFVSQCYASYLAKARDMATIEPQDFDSSLIMLESGKFVRETVKKKEHFDLFLLTRNEKIYQNCERYSAMIG